MKRYSLGLYEKAMPNNFNLIEKLHAVKRAGFDFMEMSVDETPEKLERLNMTKAERLEVIKAMYQADISVRSMCLSGHRKYSLGSNDKETELRGINIMRGAIELADDLGIRIVQLAGYDVYYEEGSSQTKQRFIENILKATEYAASHGVVLGFETMETEFMNTVSKAMEYVNLVGSSYLAVYPDLGNITNAAKLYGTDLKLDIYSGRGHMCAMHLKETLPGQFREIPYGAGHVDFKNGIKYALECGIYRFVAELWDREVGEWENDNKKASDTMRSILDNL